ncbi:MAG: DUF2202 domain-containing protein [Campylobacterota bacterium]|nr:DUF2202 domain-containing protein [Campylobacterota bacterium]
MNKEINQNNRVDQNNRRGFLSKMLIAGAGGIALFSTSSYASSNNNISTTLTEEQKDRLFFIYQEEKVARDVYIYLGELYPDESTFASIQLSEQRHMDAAQKLCINYGIDVSMIDESEGACGEFEVDYLQTLYNECIALGEVELVEALKVGKLIEETDIGTLTESIESMDMPDDIIRTYEVLREGSYNHLESYEASIARELR